MQNMEPAEHECSKNYDGSSKAMEADGALELVVQAKRERGLIVGWVVADDVLKLPVSVDAAGLERFAVVWSVD